MAKHPVLLVALLLMCSSLCVLSSPLSRRSPGFRLCGARLVETLYMICGGEFYGPDIEVRDAGSEQDARMSGADPSWLLGLGASRSGDLSSSRLMTKRHRLGVVDECCLKSCSYTVLASYCGK